MPNTAEATPEVASEPKPPALPPPRQRKMPDERKAITQKFDIAGHEGFFTVGLYDDGTPGEIFIVISKEGSTMSGFADAFAQAVSYALQYGVPLKDLVGKFSYMRFQPDGQTNHPEIKHAYSIVDFIFRWMALNFLTPTETLEAVREGVPANLRNGEETPPP